MGFYISNNVKIHLFSTVCWINDYNVKNKEFIYCFATSYLDLVAINHVNLNCLIFTSIFPHFPYSSQPLIIEHANFNNYTFYPRWRTTRCIRNFNARHGTTWLTATPRRNEPFKAPLSNDVKARFSMKYHDKTWIKLWLFVVFRLFFYRGGCKTHDKTISLNRTR